MSLSKKTVKWLSKNASISLKNKTILITGANSGVGYKTAEVWLYLGANIIMVCRNLDKDNQARNELLNEYKDANIRILEFNLANLFSIDNFINIIKSKKIDIGVFYLTEKYFLI